MKTPKVSKTHNGWNIWSTSEYTWGGSVSWHTMCQCFRTCWWAEKGDKKFGGYSSGDNTRKGSVQYSTKKSIVKSCDIYDHAENFINTNPDVIAFWVENPKSGKSHWMVYSDLGYLRISIMGGHNKVKYFNIPDPFFKSKKLKG